MPASHTSTCDARLPTNLQDGSTSASISDLCANFDQGYVLAASRTTGFITRCEPFANSHTRALRRATAPTSSSSSTTSRVVASASEALTDGNFHPAALADMGSTRFDALEMAGKEILASIQGQLVAYNMTKGGAHHLSRRLGSPGSGVIKVIAVRHGSVGQRHSQSGPEEPHTGSAVVCATGSTDGTICIWDLDQSMPLASWSVSSLPGLTKQKIGVTSMDWKDDVMVLGLESGHVCILSGVVPVPGLDSVLKQSSDTTRNATMVARYGSRPVSDLALLPSEDGVITFCAGEEHFQKVTFASRETRNVKYGRVNAHSITAFETVLDHQHAQHSLAITGESDGTVCIFDVQRSHAKDDLILPLRQFDPPIPLKTLHTPSAITSLCMTPLVLIIGQDDGRIRVIEPLGGETIRSWNDRQARLGARQSGMENGLESDRPFAVRTILANLYRCVAAVGTKIQAWDFEPQHMPKHGSKRHRLCVNGHLRGGPHAPKAVQNLDLHHDLQDYHGELAADRANRAAMSQRAMLFNLGKDDSALAGMSEAEMIEYAMMLSRDAATQQGSSFPRESRMDGPVFDASAPHEETWDQSSEYDEEDMTLRSLSQSPYASSQAREALEYSEFGFGTGSWRRRPSELDSRIQISPRPSPVLSAQSPDSPSFWAAIDRTPSPSLLSISPASLGPMERALHWPMPSESSNAARRGSRSKTPSPRLAPSLPSKGRDEDLSTASVPDLGELGPLSTPGPPPRADEKPIRKWSEVLQSESPMSLGPTASARQVRVRPAAFDTSTDDELQFVMQLSLAEANSRIDV